MPTRLWQSLALILSFAVLAIVVGDLLAWQQYTDSHVDIGPAVPGGWMRVLDVDGTPAENGGLRSGDLIRPEKGRVPLREMYGNLPLGAVQAWDVRRGDATFATRTVTGTAHLDDIAYATVSNVVRLAMVAVAIVVALRSPDVAAARALVTFLVAFGFISMNISSWIPDAWLSPIVAVRQGLTFVGLGFETYFASIFPARSARGVRHIIERAALPLTWIAAGTFVALQWLEGAAKPAWLDAVRIPLQYTPYLFIVLMCIAFPIGTREARGADRQRALWASGSLLVGFAGPVLSTTVRLVLGVYPPWIHFFELSLIAIPLGLAYTILRHRTIDIGFVISRAVVLTTVSFIVLAVFGLLERALGKIFIDASHVASRTVEIALALGLGFSLRTLHARVERGVDYIFFRSRQRSLAALRAFARDVAHITDASTVIERTIATVETHAGAAYAAVLTEVGGDDPLFVRLRATREPVALRDVESRLAGDLAFPMLVRGEVTGTLVLGEKRSGEAYDPEERALVREIAERAGLALDALQTLAIRRELEALRAAIGGAPLRV